MRKLVAIFAVVVLVFTFAACGKTDPITLYDGNDFTVTRQGAKITIVDNDTGREYHLAIQRVKSRSEGAKQAQTVIDDGSLHIETAFNLIRIARYDRAGAIFVRVSP